MIDDKLKKEILSYCKLNELDYDNFLNNLIRKAFMIEKYGDRPMAPKSSTLDKPEISEVNYIFAIPKKKKNTRRAKKETVVTQQEEHKTEPVSEEPKKIFKRKLNE